MALVIFVFFGRIEPSRIEFWFLMQVGEGVRLLHVLSDELAVDKTWHQDGDVAKPPS